MKTNSPSPRPGPTAALVVALLQEAFPKTWERLLRNRLGAADPADLTPAQFAEFAEHVFWLVKQSGIRDPAAWLAFRAQLDTSSQITSPDIDNDVQNPGAAGSRKIAAKPSSASQPAQAGERIASSGAPDTPEAGDEIDEITIRSKRYVSADRLAQMLGISRRSLNRKGKAPPQIKIGNKVFFEVK